MTQLDNASWLQIVASCDQSELLETALDGAGALAVTIRGTGDEILIEPEPGATPMWQRTELTALFPAGTDAGQLGTELEAMLRGYHLDWHAEIVEDRDWVRAWMDDYQPMRFGNNLWVCPRHAQVNDPNATILRLDPGLAFGTGTHPTTALCLEWLDAHPPNDLTVLDYGCGSGVLALAAARMGAAGTVQAVDTDQQALVATKENAADNDIPAKLEVGPVSTAQKADIVLANILAGPLIELASTLSELVRPGGQLILSGILSEQAETVQAAYADHFSFDSGASQNGWVRLDGTSTNAYRNRSTS